MLDHAEVEPSQGQRRGIVAAVGDGSMGVADRPLPMLVAPSGAHEQIFIAKRRMTVR